MAPPRSPSTVIGGTSLPQLKRSPSRQERVLRAFANRADGAPELERLEEAQDNAQQYADRLRDREQAARRIMSSRPSVVNLARSESSLSSTGSMGDDHELAVHRAVRETARDCMRREELARRHEATRQASQLAEMRAAALEARRRDEQQRLRAREKLEDEFAARKLELTRARRNNTSSGREVRESEKQDVLRVRQADASRLSEERARRAQAREEARGAQKQKAERAEAEREASFEAQRKARKELRSRVLANRADEEQRAFATILLEAEGVLARLDAAVQLGPPYPRDEPLDRLQMRRESAQRRVAAAQHNLEMASLRARDPTAALAAQPADVPTPAN